MASWGLLGGFGAGMMKAGDNMIEIAKQDRINEFRMKMQESQQTHQSGENAKARTQQIALQENQQAYQTGESEKNRAHQVTLQEGQQQFTAEQAKLKASNDLEVAKTRGARGNWDQYELENGTIVLIDRYTGETRPLETNPVFMSQENAALPSSDFHSSTTTPNEVTGSAESNQAKDVEINSRSNALNQASSSSVTKPSTGGQMSRNNTPGSSGNVAPSELPAHILNQLLGEPEWRGRQGLLRRYQKD